MDTDARHAITQSVIPTATKSPATLRAEVQAIRALYNAGVRLTDRRIAVEAARILAAEARTTGAA